VEVTTDVACAKNPKTSLAVGTLGAVDATVPASSTFGCEPDADSGLSRIGRVVLLPSESESGPLAFTVVTAFTTTGPNPADPSKTIELNPTLESCQSLAMGLSLGEGSSPLGCLVARRALQFREGHRLTLSLEMDSACSGTLCDDTTTCEAGTCRDLCEVEGSACSSTSATGRAAMRHGTAEPEGSLEPQGAEDTSGSM